MGTGGNAISTCGNKVTPLSVQHSDTTRRRRYQGSHLAALFPVMVRLVSGPASCGTLPGVGK
eukprot:6273364-Pyramimonas_sp.AAC.1